jgi:general secretion pathway protein C
LKSNLLSQRNIFYLNLALGMLLILATLFFIRDIITVYFEKGHSQKKAVSVPNDTAGIQKKKQLAEYSSILKNNPFGFSGGEIRPLTGSASNVQQSNIMLLGTVVGPEKLTYAVFRNNAGQQEVFKIGESVFGSGVLQKVKQDKAFIRNGVNITEIPIEDIKVKEVKKQGSAGIPSSSVFAQKVGKGAYVVDQARLQQAIANPSQMMTDARLRPNVAGGKEEGYVLSEIKPGGIYQSLGLQDGDVLLRINEYDISNPEKALQAFTALKGLDRVQIDLIRSGSRMTMTYQIK